jgi:hypothetical protein
MSARKPTVPEIGDETVSINLSAYPQITAIYDGRPAAQNYHNTYVTKGYTDTLATTFIKKALSGTAPVLIVQGKNMQYTTAVYLSTSDGVFTNSITGLADNDLFATSTNLSALYPAFSGYNINNLSASDESTSKAHGYTIINEYLLEVTLPVLENLGYMDIIIVNPAGYNTLMNSLTSTIRIY